MTASPSRRSPYKLAVRCLWITFLGLGMLLLTSVGMAKVDFSRVSAPDDLQLTIYQSADLTLVTERRRVHLEDGKNRLRFRWEGQSVDPASVSLRLNTEDDSVRVLEQTYPPDTARESVWVLEAENPGQTSVTIHYFLTGIRVNLSYWGTLVRNGFEFTLEGRANLQNLTEQAFEQAKVNVLVGKVQLLENVAKRLERWREFRSSATEDPARPSEARAARYESARAAIQKAPMADSAKPGSVPAQALTDYWLLDLGTGVQLHPRASSSRWFLPYRTVDVNPRYQVNTGTLQGTKQYLVFRNRGGTHSDTRPLPEGPVRLRSRGSQGRGISLGTSRLDYAPPGDTVQLELPVARGLRSETVLVDRAHENFKFDDQGNLTGQEVLTVRRTRIENQRSVPVHVDLHHHFKDQHWRVEEASHPYHRVNYREIAFRRRLAAGEVMTVRTVVRRFEGSRRD